MLEDLLSESATALRHTGKHAARVSKLTRAHEARVLLWRKSHVVTVLGRTELWSTIGLHVVSVGWRPVHFIGILLRSKAFHSLMTWLVARISSREKRVITQLLRQLLHVAIVVENTWVLRSSTHVLRLLLLVLARGVSVGVWGKCLLVRMREAATVSVIEFATRAQSRNVVPLDVLHLEVWAAGVRRQESRSISLLLLVLLIEEQHLQHVLTMNQLVL